MELKVTNNNKGQRGIYAGGDLVFVDAGKTGTFTGVTKQEADDAAKIDGFRVWLDGKQITEDKPPAERPWLVIARDPSGEGMRKIDLSDGEWFVGTAIASDRPASPLGYSFTKIGGNVEAVPETVVVPAEPEITVQPSPADDTPAPEPVPDSPAAALVAGNARDVVEAIEKADPDEVAAIASAENAREGGPRKGVLKAIADRRDDPIKG
jgi:hypothetical protein